MSEPTYRINTERKIDPQFPNIPWTARVTRLSDGALIASQYGNTEKSVIDKARELILALEADDNEPAGGVYFANSDGTINPPAPTPEPQSLRA